MPPPTLNEDTLSEKPAIEQLARMGYEFIPGEKLDPQESEDCERSSRRDVVLVKRLKRKLAELNPEATESTIDKAVRRATNLQGTSLLCLVPGADTVRDFDLMRAV